ncbi:hypothetical protein ACLB2K_037516 [Fragaria x ananassa]
MGIPEPFREHRRAEEQLVQNSQARIAVRALEPVQYLQQAGRVLLLLFIIRIQNVDFCLGMTLARFYQQYWHVVGDDINEVCLKVLNEAAELNELNHSLIALIPKIENPQQVTDFKPISLCNVIYKLISKTIVNRMKAVLPEVISQYQSAFVPGRCIHDNVITAFEVIHSIKAKLAGDVPHCVLKLDISKAYDRVEWVFLQGVLQKLGFKA